MYTDFRPGIFIEKKFLNGIFRSIDSKVRKKLKKINDFDIEQKSIYKAISEYFSSPNLDTNAHVYVTGHSLGGAWMISMTISSSIEKAQERFEKFFNEKVDDFKSSLKKDADEYLKSADKIVKEYLKSLDKIPKQGKQDIEKFRQNMERLEQTIAPGAYIIRTLFRFW